MSWNLIEQIYFPASSTTFITFFFDGIIKIFDFDDFAGVTDQQRVLTPPWYLILSQFFFLENHFKNDISSSLFKEACMVIRQIVAL